MQHETRVLCWTNAALSRFKSLAVKQRSLMSSRRLGSPKAPFFHIFLDELFNNLLKIVVNKKFWQAGGQYMGGRVTIPVQQLDCDRFLSEKISLLIFRFRTTGPKFILEVGDLPEALCE